MLILVLDGSTAAGARFGLVEQRPDGLHTLLDRHETGQGAAVRLPSLVAEALRATPRRPALIASIAGPGSFTGLRATLALAHGIAAGIGAAVCGVSVGEALAPALSRHEGPLWCVSQARRDRVFIEGVSPAGLVDAPLSVMLDALPVPSGAPLLAGDASAAVGAVLSGRGIAWRAGPVFATPLQIAEAALRRESGDLPPRPAQPLYVDPPEAKLPGGRSPAIGS